MKSLEFGMYSQVFSWVASNVGQVSVQREFMDREQEVQSLKYSPEHSRQ